MREIKFRAWHKTEEGMGEVLIFAPAHRYVECQMLSSRYNKVPFRFKDDIAYWELMQYTGLKDKNGREIYEGDIVQRTKPYEVIWMGYGWWLRNIMNGASFPIGRYSEYEVIGNIHDNPELSKEGLNETR